MCREKPDAVDHRGRSDWAERYAKDHGYELWIQNDRLCLTNIKVPGDQFEARHIETILRHLHAELRQAGAGMERDKPHAIACYLHGPSGAGGVRTVHDDDRVAMTGREAETLIVAGAGGWERLTSWETVR